MKIKSLIRRISDPKRQLLSVDIDGETVWEGYAMDMPNEYKEMNFDSFGFAFGFLIINIES